MPGAGKTVIASLVIEHLQEISKHNQSVCVAFAYCRYTERIPITTILAALLRQILERYPSVLPFVQALYERHNLEQTQPDQGDLITVLLEIATSGLFSSSFFVLDGLDEASVDVQFDLIETLESLPIRFLLTSRPLDLLKDQVPGAVFFNIAASDADIAVLVEEKIDRIPTLRRLLRQNGNLKGEVVAKIMEKSSGMFLLASLQMELLQASGCPSIKALRDCLDRLPAGINATYEATMGRIERNAHADLVKLALTWVVCASRPLLVDEVRLGIAVDPHTYEFDVERLVDQEFLVSSCCGLIIVERGLSETVRLVHFTARDYLQSYLADHWSCNPHSIIASVCTVRLLQYKFHDFPGQPVEETIYKLCAKDQMLRYAYENWAKHARQCSPFPKDVLAFVRQCQRYPIDGELGGDMHVAVAHDVEEYLAPLNSGVHEQVVGKSSNKTLAINASTENGTTPLMLAIKDSHYIMANVLLSATGIDVHTRDTTGKTALIMAVGKGQVDIVRRLLSFGHTEANPKTEADHTAMSVGDGQSALLLAAYHGYEDILRLLCKAPGLDVNATDDSSETTLTKVLNMVRAWRPTPRPFQVLLDVPGIDANAGAEATLSLAAKLKIKWGVEALLACPNIDVNKEGPDNYTALEWAAYHGDLQTLEVLLNHPRIDVNGGKYGALTLAAQQGHLDVVTTLLRVRSIDVNKANLDGHTALTKASAGRRSSIDAFERPTTPLPYEWPAQGHFAVVETLLGTEGIDVNAGKSSKRGTALIHAAREGRSVVVDALLLADKIDVNATDSEGRTAFQWARDRGYQEVVDLLRALGI
ncbi:ankyrin [Coprinopsis marcescibilis]|uniref:Ankyrin n=1 Tax=Coprinopsis marcescibilis TaxID=230819 RepID=A0A5C3LGP8_COPMA|nr:ankyrin [Coprinopsis marcescibilis]